MDQFRSLKVLFLGDQDGAYERQLKMNLCRFLASAPQVSMAYLARVSYQETPGPCVTLCLLGGRGNAAKLVERVGVVFKELFDGKEHLDILFMSDIQAREIEKVAKPFYVRGGS